MTLNPTQLESMVEWCASCLDLAEARDEAWRTFFGEDDSRPVRYWEGVGGFTPRQRRFLGRFLFGFFLEDGQRKWRGRPFTLDTPKQPPFRRPGVPAT